MPIKKLANYFNKATADGGFGKKDTGLSFGSSSDPMYDKLYKANPYVNMTYNKSAWQGLLSGLGFRTDYDRWLEEAQVNANEYDAQVASIEQQNQYNSPQAEAQRMKQAGMNPDLVGLENVAESASPNVDPQGMSPGAGESGEFGEITQKLWNFGTGILSLYQVGVGLAKDMMTFKQMKNGIEAGDIQLGKDFMNFANDFVLQNSPAQPFESDEAFNDHHSRVMSDLYAFPKFMRFSRRQRRIWNSVVSREYFNSSDFERLTSSWKRSSENLRDVSRTPTGLGRISLDSDRDSWSAFNTVANSLSSLADEVYKMQQRSIKDISEAGSATAKFDKSLANSRVSQGVPGAQAKAEKEQFGLAEQNAKVDHAINSTMSRLVSDLERQANDGDLLAAGLLLAMQIFRMSNFKFGSKSSSVSF